MKKKNREGTSYWSSYSDMMAALILVFSLIISVTMYQARADLEAQAQELENAKAELAETTRELEDIVGVRRDIVKSLLQEFGEDMNIKIDEATGDIMFSTQILFDVNKSNLKPEGEAFLRNFFPRYIKLLMSDGIKECISEIIVEGHTDPDGGYIYNLNLSQNRATSVVSYCMTETNGVLLPDEINYLQTVLSANGKSFSELKYYDEEKTQVDYDASRRVEIKFRLVDEDQVEQMLQVLKSQMEKTLG